MSNDYYKSPKIVPGSMARSAQVNEGFDAVSIAFDKMPTEDALKENRVTVGTDSGTADAYVITSAYPRLSYTPLMEVVFLPGNSCTGASTINLDGIGPKPIKRMDGEDPRPGDIEAGVPCILRFDQTVFRITSGPPNDAAHAAASATAAADSATKMANITDAAANSASAAAKSAQKAADYAAGVNLPPVDIKNAGEALFVKDDGSGYEPGVMGLVTVAASADVDPAEILTRYICDTSAAPFTITLPASPAEGDRIGIADAGENFATNNLTIARNGKTIAGDASDLAVDLDRATFELIHIGDDWRIT